MVNESEVVKVSAASMKELTFVVNPQENVTATLTSVDGRRIPASGEGSVGVVTASMVILKTSPMRRYVLAQG